ncbi:unnamed protein product [Bursaphelenchus okinawaensis]|uniref:SCP domain-containing protein n=1 Tax=Bursaphelenchus okinawaensis TaxID=465554 RepID=A0A811L9H7_9BILA|nr:unnamed protein product [Bursaphelenchus okinawaensis]CAG9119171.1 unnamed protein product [Bursaphelenchus okinawaensis]
MLKFVVLGLVIATAAGQLSASDRQYVVDQHNKYRAQVAGGTAVGAGNVTLPTAGDMKALVYSTDLEQEATTYAEKCVWAHSGTQDGENLYSLTRTSTENTVNLGAAITAWYNEVTTFSPSGIPSYAFVEADGHFTQVIWANTSEVGCDVASCPTLTNLEGSNYAYIVCNYRAAGNVVSLPIYTEADPASQCPSGYVADSPLCVVATTGTTTTNTGTTTANTGTTASGASTSSTTAGTTGSTASEGVSSTAVTSGSTASSDNDAASKTPSGSDPTTTRGCRTRPYQY